MKALDKAEIGAYFITENQENIRLVSVKGYSELFETRGGKEFITYLVPLETWNTFVGLSWDMVRFYDIAVSNPKKVRDVNYSGSVIFNIENGNGYVELACRGIFY